MNSLVMFVIQTILMIALGCVVIGFGISFIFDPNARADARDLGQHLWEWAVGVVMWPGNLARAYNKNYQGRHRIGEVQLVSADWLVTQ